MAIEDWIDEVVKVAGSVASHTGGFVRAYRIASKSEIPEALSAFPCAIVYATHPTSLQLSEGGPCKEIWAVRGEFYCFSDVKKTNLPELIRYFSKIRDATLLKRKLGGMVDYFTFAEEEPMFLAEMTYEKDGSPHHGIAVNWIVKSDVGGELTFGL